MNAARFHKAGALAGLALLGLVSIGAQAPAPTPVPETVRLVLRPGSRLWLEGDSNVHAWTCDATAFTPELRIERPSRDQPLARVEKAVLDVPVAKIDCGHGKMNENLRKALKANDYPSITFVVTGAEFVDTGDQGAIELLATGHLYVAGEGREIKFQVSGTDTGDGALRIRGRVGIKMTDYGIQPPTAMLGVLKTKDDVMILFDLKAEYSPLEEATS